MITKRGFECYRHYVALQQHFSTSYDWFKYNGKVRAKSDSYLKRNDKYAFEKMAKLIPEGKWVNFLVAHFKKDPKCWIKSMSKAEWERHESILVNLAKTFRDDLQSLAYYHKKDLFFKPGVPTIYELMISSEINKETVCILDEIFHFMEKDKDNFIVEDEIKACLKYKPFVIREIEDINIYKDLIRIYFM